MKRKNIIIVETILLTSLLVACENRKTGTEEGIVASSIQTTEEINITSETFEEESKMKTERLKPSEFTNLPKVAGQVGFSFRAIESFSNGFVFGNFSTMEEQVKDANGEAMDEVYNVVKVNYYKRDKVVDIDTVVYIHPKTDETVKSNTYVSTQIIEGKEVTLTETILRMVPKDYVMTEEDKLLEQEGQIGFSCNGVTTGDVYFRKMYWEEEGLIYTIDSGVPDISVEELKKMVEEYMCGVYQ